MDGGEGKKKRETRKHGRKLERSVVPHLTRSAKKKIELGTTNTKNAVRVENGENCDRLAKLDSKSTG